MEDMVFGKFKIKKIKHEEIKKTLIEGLEEYIDPYKDFENWDAFFLEREDVLELYLSDFDDYFSAEEYMKNEFVKKYGDVTFEFGMDDYTGIYKIIYDGNEVKTQEEKKYYCVYCGERVELNRGVLANSTEWYCNEECRKNHLIEVIIDTASMIENDVVVEMKLDEGELQKYDIKKLEKISNELMIKRNQEKMIRSEKSIRVKDEIRNYINENGKPSVVYFYDDCSVALSYTDAVSGVEVLSDKTFGYWEETVFIGTNRIQEEWMNLFDELGVIVPVCPMEYRNT